MKKLLVKAQYIIQEYQAPVEGIEAVIAQPEKWVKDDVEVFTEPENVEEYVYHPAIEAVEGVEAKPEIPEVKETRIIAQTQGTDEELAAWLAGDEHKYPEGYQVEYIDISAQVEQEKINAEALDYLIKTDWMQIRFTETGIAMPEYVKIKRQEAREKIIHL